MEPLGLFLKKERESRNISIEEVASSTKIVGRYLRAVEEDRFDTMPGGFFIKGIIRAYAKYLGLDEDEVTRRYEEAGLFTPVPKERPKKIPDPPLYPRRGRLIVRGVVLGVIVIVSVTMILVWRSHRPRTNLPELKAQVVVPQNKPQPQPAAVPAEPEWKGITIDITFQEKTWLQIYTDGALRFSGEMQAGQTTRMQADKELVLNVGNAGGLSFLLNGKPAKVLGRENEVIKDIKITPENYQQFLQDKEPKGPST